MEVGIRELRADLSRWLKRVQAGEEVVVTDRGRAAARIVPIAVERPLDRLIREGMVVSAPRPWRGKLPKPIEDAGPLSDIVLEDRR